MYRVYRENTKYRLYTLNKTGGRGSAGAYTFIPSGVKPLCPTPPRIVLLCFCGLTERKIRIITPERRGAAVPLFTGRPTERID